VVTGGLGFIGSNLVHRLVHLGAHVRVVDAAVAAHGGDRRNVPTAVEVALVDIGDPSVADVVAGADIVFNVAGQVSHTASMRDPLADLHLNSMTHASFLETMRRVNPSCRIVHTSTRQVYGRPIRLPVDELHPARPVDVNGVAKLAGEQLHMVYAHAHSMPITSLRLTNVYGPRQRLTSDELGFLPVFFRKALLGETISIFGDGEQQRDCLYVADVVDALLLATSDDAVARVFNVGHHQLHSLNEVARMIVDATGSASDVKLVPWPDDHARIDIGSFHTDGTRIHQRLGWDASTSLQAGVAQTVAFYREHEWYLSST
jgi:UDP-glucose 4-epimerase